MEFFRQKSWSGLPFPSPGDLPTAGIKPGSLALQADFLPSEPPGKPHDFQDGFEKLCFKNDFIHSFWELSKGNRKFSLPYTFRNGKSSLDGLKKKKPIGIRDVNEIHVTGFYIFINAALIITIIIRNQWFLVTLKCKFKAETFGMWECKCRWDRACC